LSGKIPAALGDMTALEWLILSENELSGPIPPELGSLTQLQHIDLSNNALEGSIPCQFGEMQELQRINLQNNLLSGSVPETFLNLPNLDPGRPGSWLILGGNCLAASGEVLDFVQSFDWSFPDNQLSECIGNVIFVDRLEMQSSC
jgi:hypothetical protein